MAFSGGLYIHLFTPWLVLPLLCSDHISNSDSSEGTRFTPSISMSCIHFALNHDLSRSESVADFAMLDMRDTLSDITTRSVTAPDFARCPESLPLPSLSAQQHLP